MATQTLTLVSAADEEDETAVAFTITVEADDNTLTGLRAVDVNEAEYDVRFELTSRANPLERHCCRPDAVGGIVCEPGPCRPHD